MTWRRIGEWRYSSTHSLTSALDGGEWSASRPGRFIHREGALGTYWIGDWVGPRAVLDVVVKKKIPSPRQESNSRTPIFQPVAQRYTDWAITALISLSFSNKILYRLFFFPMSYTYNALSILGMLDSKNSSLCKTMERWTNWKSARMLQISFLRFCVPHCTQVGSMQIKIYCHKASHTRDVTL
jgi:hypothetical protein